jgi:hypothetical protein
MIHEHTLIVSNGFKVTMSIDTEGPKITFAWSPHMPKQPRHLEVVSREYIPWRDKIIADFAKSTGQRIAVLTFNPNQAPNIKGFDTDGTQHTI